MTEPLIPVVFCMECHPAFVFSMAADMREQIPSELFAAFAAGPVTDILKAGKP